MILALLWAFFVGTLLAPADLAGQVSTAYGFTQSSGSYSAITGGTLLWGDALGLTNFDDEVSSAQTIPTFNFAGTAQTSMYVSVNGFITFGSAPSGTNYAPLSSTETYSGAIAAFGTDVRSRSSSFVSKDVRWQTVGNEIVVQWRGVRRYNAGSENWSCQVRMNTSTSEVKLVYSSVSNLNSSTADQPEVGLRGPNNNFALNVLNRRVGTGSENWATSLSGTANNSKMRFTSNSPSKSFTNGLTYTFAPSCITPAATATLIPDCINDQFSIQVQVTALGDAPSVNISSPPGSVVHAQVGLGTYMVGPFPNGSPQGVVVEHTVNGACDLDLGQYSGVNCFSNGACVVSGPAIPDNGCAGNNVLDVGIAMNGLPTTLGASPGQAVLQSVDLIIAHTYRGDLRISLISPQGQARDLVLQRPSSSAGGNNLGNVNNCPNAPLTLIDGGASLSTMNAGTTNAAIGQFAPEQSLAGFTGDPNGVWTLRICDNAALDVGDLRHVKLNFQVIDCLGVPDGAALPGSACDDGDACTVGDVFDPNCNCVGTVQDSDNDGICDATDSCPFVPGQIGGPCDDGDACTEGDLLDVNCNCAGTYQDSDNDGICDATDSCPNTPGQIGDACDDGDPFTSNDAIDAGCVCTGIPVPCANWMLDITTDGAGSETTWQIQDANGPFVLASGGPYGNNNTFHESVCIPEGNCFKLTVLDSGNDGISGGGYVLRNQNGDRVIDNSGNGGLFTAASTLVQGFCASTGPVKLTLVNCDREDFLITESVECTSDPAVSAEWGTGSQTDDGYQFWFFDPNGGYSRRILRDHASSGGFGPPGPTRACRLHLGSMVTLPLPLDVLLNVRVRPLVNGVYGDWGPACRMRVLSVAPTCPLTKLVDDPTNPNFSCGVVRAFGGSDKVYCRPVSGANRYKFRFENVGEGYLRNITSTNPGLVLNWVTLPLENGGNYDVTVAASLDNGATYCPFGSTCVVTIQDPPGAQAFRVDPVHDASELLLWPNPVRDGLVNLRLEGLIDPEQRITIDVHDMLGKRTAHLETDHAGGSFSTTLDLGGSPSGIYLVLVTTNGQVLQQRVNVE
ncbi:MAG: proprotein convertase P-domain-containing protein [Flavobacteriales bacterium]|nr:proprotein convertase P-domain-containing protein [Flavobacteriales bacterium]